MRRRARAVVTSVALVVAGMATAAACDTAKPLSVVPAGSSSAPVRPSAIALSPSPSHSALPSPSPSVSPGDTRSPDRVLLAAGDIASCDSSGDEATAKLLDRYAGTVAALGDSAYRDGSPADFANCYGPTWGRHKARIRPAVGNHEYLTSGASGYFGYFGAAAGAAGKGYYSYDLGSWHIVVLNSECGEVSCVAGSAQERWLRADLAASRGRCQLAYWHKPLFTSGSEHGNATEMRPIFRALYAAGAEIVLTGHNHNYERFGPQDPAGGLDTRRGIREFVVGTGGASHYEFGVIQPNSQVRNADTYGVLRLALRADGYTWRFLPQAGKTFTDSGSGTCR